MVNNTCELIITDKIKDTVLVRTELLSATYDNNNEIKLIYVDKKEITLALEFTNKDEASNIYNNIIDKLVKDIYCITKILYIDYYNHAIAFKGKAYFATREEAYKVKATYHLVSKRFIHEKTI